MPTVTVVPSDNIIIVDGEGLFFNFQAPANLHALQWYGSNGHMEWTDKGNTELSEAEYDNIVAPYVVLYNAEVRRLDALEAQRLAEYNSYDAQCTRIREERNNRLQLCDGMNPMRWATLTETQQKAWANYRQALLDITTQNGFPWEGDIENVPWPVLELK